MIIGIDARPLSYYLTGMGQYLKNVLETLQRIDKENIYYLISNKTINFPLNNPRWHKLEGRLDKKLLSSAWMQMMAPLFALKYRFNLFWGPRHHLPLLMPKHIRQVVTIHDLIHIRYPETMPMPNWFVERLLMRRSILHADAAIAVSQSTADEIGALYERTEKQRIHAIYSGIPSWTDPEPSPEKALSLPENYFLFVGTVEPRKNLVNILTAFERLAAWADNCFLVIAGETGWKTNALNAKMRSGNLKSRVIQTGFVSRGSLMQIYENALCLLFPSFYEGFGFPILEAMSLGTPVITSNSGSMKEIAGDAALLVDPIQVDEIERAMRRILESPGLADQLKERAKSRLAMFSWQKCAESILDVFCRVSNN